MTREELLKKIDFEKNWLYECGIFGSDVDIAFHAIKKSVIEALEQEPCEDAVSRQAVIELCEGWWLGHTKEDDFSTEVRALPSVNPQKPKMGHWKERRNRATGHIETVCSECGAEEGYPYNDYCGNCGAQMFEPQESEEEE